MRPSRTMAYIVVCLLYFATLVQAAEIRKLGSNDLEWATPNQGAATTTVSPGGKTVTKIDAAQVPFRNVNGHVDNLVDGSYSLTLKVADLITGGPWVDVRARSAICNGIADDATEVQNAIDNATSGDTILVVGTCGIGVSGWVGLTVSAKTDITIEGRSYKDGFKVLAAPSQTTGSNPEPTVIKVINSSGIKIRGLNIKGNSINAQLIGLDNCSNCEVSGNYLHDTGNANANGVFSVGGNRNIYAGNWITNVGRGLWIGNTGGVTEIETSALIEGNQVWNNLATGIGGTLKDSIIRGNVSRDNAGSGIALGSASYTTTIYQGVSITGNVSKGNAFHGIQSDVVGAYYVRGISVQGNTIEDNDGSGIYAPNATDWSITGNTIRNNNYDASGTGYGITMGPLAWNMSISGNTIYDDQATHTQTTGILGNAYNTVNGVDNIIVTGNVVRGHTLSGIQFTRSSTGTGSNIIITSNTSMNNGFDGINISGYGAYTKSVLSNNISVGNARYGYHTEQGRGLTGVNNVALSNALADYNGQIGYLSGSYNIWYATGVAAPTDNVAAYVVGDIVFNIGTDNAIGWRNSSAGTPGTWKYMRVTLEP